MSIYKVHLRAPKDQGERTLCGLALVQQHTTRPAGLVPLGVPPGWEYKINGADPIDCRNCLTKYYEGAKRP